MCSDCEEDHDPICGYCGDSCFGKCDNPDACRSCWLSNCVPWIPMYDDFEDMDEDFLDTCLETECTCNCHDDLFDDLGYRFEAGVLKVYEEDGPPYDRKGVFPFLKLPGEIREKIYNFSFLQYGKQRKGPRHRGSIHTALLGTCRQIYNEARHLPLTLNKLCFSSALSAHDFLGFFLAPTQKDLITSIHIEFHMMEFPDLSWTHLMRELAKMPITHLGLTIKGRVPKEQMLGHTCFTNRFKSLKGLKTLDLVLPSVLITAQDKKEIQEEMRGTLIKDYKRSKLIKMAKPKRAASTDLATGSKKATKKAKKSNTPIKHQAKIVPSPKTSRLTVKSRKAERDAEKAATNRAKQALLDRHDQLKQYATSIDLDAAPVKIRLEQAREAAEAMDEAQFEKLAHGIVVTLEERYDKISAARKEVPVFRTPPSSPESMSCSSEGSNSSLDDHENFSQL